jgi:hypothetical protein
MFDNTLAAGMVGVWGLAVWFLETTLENSTPNHRAADIIFTAHFIPDISR